MAAYIATGQVPEMISAFGIDRFAADHLMADAGSTGTR